MTGLLHRLALAAKPVKVRRALLAWLGSASLEEKILLDLHPRPHFAYGIYQAALQARRLGLTGITSIEFGVAGGNGLIAMERVAGEIEQHLGVKIQIAGFDTGEGMPEAADYRDLPYVWKKGYFKMDEAQLRSRLQRAQLYLGQIAQTLDAFVQTNPHPVGFISIDVDYYSSTVQALRLLERPDTLFLPRTFMYFDDIIGEDPELHSEFAGELLAINEFNAAHPHMKIAKINGLMWKRQMPQPWNEAMFVLHRFQHAEYNTHLVREGEWHLRLAD